MKNFIIAIFFIISLGAANLPRDVSMADYLSGLCKQADQNACLRLETMEKEQQQAQEMQEHAIAFAPRLADGQYATGNKPDLEAAYPVVMRDYIQFESASGHETGILDERRLSSCARHYHNYWVNRKLWWPTADDGKPDWASIYVYIVDHYFGYCLRQ